MDITLNEKQELACERFVRWLGQPAQPYVLQGYAGTGKTTLTQQFLRLMPAQARVAAMAPTGKAARVLASRTGLAATTIHRFMYRPVTDEIKALQERITEIHDMSDELNDELLNEIRSLEERVRELSEGSEARFVRKQFVERVDYLLVDEASMVTESIYQDLLSLEIPIIFVGDPFQLPPVKATAGWDSLKPDVVLDEIMRTDAVEGLGINLAAEAVRLDYPMTEGPGFHLHPRKSLGWVEYSKADIVLAGTHVVRRHLNDGIRRHLGLPPGEVAVGDRLICMSNNPIYNIVNGEIFTVEEIRAVKPRTVSLKVRNELDEVKFIPAWKELFMDDSNTRVVPFSVAALTFAYCITVHKSQGSQWDRVIVTDSWNGPRYENWLYTALTRAARNCHFVR